MPVCSYLVHPAEGKADQLMELFMKMPECDAELSAKKEMIILVTLSEDKDHEKKLQDKLKSITEINCLALSFGQVQN